MRFALIVAALVTGIVPAVDSPAFAAEERARTEEGAELVGRAAPPLEVIWLDGSPVRIGGGRPVLVRWWTDGCSLCEATAPALRDVARTFGSRGLDVVAVFHPKPRPAHVDAERVRAAAQRLGLGSMSIGVDAQWTALERWWLSGAERRFTSVTFLVDARGRIAWLHAGGEWHRSGDPRHADCDRAHRALSERLERMLPR